jgi:ferric-dicitrate binding protein FerR (iron transport regulator)
MKKIFNIEKSKTKNLNQDFDLDQILKNNVLDYSELDFVSYKTDILKTYKNINNKIKSNSALLKNFTSILPHINLKPILKPIYTIVLTALVLITIIELQKNTDPVQYAEITVDEGEKITFHVTDDITIYINAESTIKIPLELKRNAKIYLDGEAYFEVNHNKTVNIVAGRLSFQSKQGQFNIKSDKNSKELIATVKEGNLDLYNPEFPKSTRLTLGKGEKATYKSLGEFIAVENNNNVNYLSWNTGILKFNEASLIEVSRTMSDYYNIPVSIENEDLKYKSFSASFKDAEIDEILDKISTNLNCKISADGSKLIIN